MGRSRLSIPNNNKASTLYIHLRERERERENKRVGADRLRATPTAKHQRHLDAVDLDFF